MRTTFLSLLALALAILSGNPALAYQQISGDYTLTVNDDSDANDNAPTSPRQAWRSGGTFGGTPREVAYRVQDKNGRTLVEGTSPPPIALAAAGRYLAVQEYNQIRVLRDFGGRAEEVAKVGKYHSILSGMNMDKWATLGNWSPDGRRLAIDYRKVDNRAIVLFDSMTETLSEIPTEAKPSKFVWSPSGKLLGAVNDTARTAVIDTGRASVVRTVPALPGAHTTSYREVKGLSEAGELIR
jgi:DNA-binding beta-propeller fold protein YncE